METQGLITSVSNAHVKRMVALQQKAALRRQGGTIVVEGQRELRHCLDAGHEPVALYRCRPLMGDTREWDALPGYEVSEEVYRKIAYRGGTEGVIAEVRPRPCTLDDLDLGSCPLIIVLESVEKPGNLGAVLRSADAARATAVVVCDPLADLYNPNVIRGSLGAVFTVPCVACDSRQCIDFLRRAGIRILTAQLQDSRPYYATDMRGPCAIAMGTESTGLTEQWRTAADEHIRIPMGGRLDSLNVSVSAAILMFEAVRQRCAGA